MQAEIESTSDGGQPATPTPTSHSNEDRPPARSGYPDHTGTANGVLIPPSLANDAFRLAWTDWQTMREQADGRPMAVAVSRAQLTQCEQMGPARAIAAIRYSIESGYKRLVEPKDGVGAQPKKPFRMPVNFQ